MKKQDSGAFDRGGDGGERGREVLETERLLTGRPVPPQTDGLHVGPMHRQSQFYIRPARPELEERYRTENGQEAGMDLGGLRGRSLTSVK